MRPNIIDLSHPIESGMTTYPGLPAPEVGAHMSRAASRHLYPEGTEFHIGSISMVSNTGTYLDAPYHRFEAGPDVAALPLAGLVHLKGIVVDATRTDVITEALVPAGDLTGCAVLFRTDWDRWWTSQVYGSHGSPHLSAGAARRLVNAGVSAVGIDSVNIDAMNDRTRPVHTQLLNAGVGVVEHLTGLAQLNGRQFRFHAAPLPVVGWGSSPVRAYAVLDGPNSSQEGSTQ